MPDLNYTFDKYTEKYQGDQLDRIRDYARDVELPDRISLEIGSNRGRFLVRMSERFPERYFVGVEQRKKYAEAGQKRVDAEAQGDVDLLHADVKLAVPVIFDPEQIAEVFIPFPDPWWKTQHRKRRVVRQEFLDKLEPKLAPGAKLWIRTDVGPFAEDMRRQLRRHADYEEIPFDDIPDRPMARSTREDHLVEEALPIHLVYFRKKAQ